MDNLTKKIKIFIWKCLKVVPPFVRAPLSRLLFKVTIKSNLSKHDDIQFSIASSIEDLSSALVLIQDNYKRLNMTDKEDLIRASKYNLLPTTIVFIAKISDEVVGTISVMVDSSLGLPIDDFSDVSQFRSGGRVVEIGGFCIKESYRSRNSGISVPLALMALRYCIEKIKADYIVLTVRKSVALFYQDICCFKPFGKKRRHSGVMGLKSASLVVDTKTYLERLKMSYQGKPIERNLYLQYIEFPWCIHAEVFSENFGLISQRTLSDKRVFNLLEVKSKVMNDLSSKERRIIANFTQDLDISSALLEQVKVQQQSREDYRFHVSLNGKAISDDRIFNINILDASHNGIKVFCDNCLPDIITIRIVMPEFGPIRLECIKKWGVNKQYGLEIVNNDVNWQRLVFYYESTMVEDELLAA